MKQIGTDAKDMEAAAVAEVACMANVSVFAMKAISDFVDSSENTHDQFTRNFSLATERLTDAMHKLLSMWAIE